MKIGDRVQVPVWTDTWMMGDRYGVVVKLTKKPVRSKFQAIHGAHEIAHVRLDKSGRLS